MDTQQWVANHKPDKLSQSAVQNNLDKRGCKTPNPQTSRAPIRWMPEDKLSCRELSQSTTEVIREQDHTTRARQ